jgi:glycosyltransferase involved in cell wall biosynthesis
VPRVSIIIPTFNCALYIGYAVESVLNQSYRDYEVIVVDDGSTDETVEIVTRYRQKVRYFYQANSGVSAARNRALSEASGAFVAYLDADDLWYPQKLDRQMEFFDGHAECGLLHSDVSVIDEQDQIVHARFNAETARAVPQGYCMEDLLRRCHIQTLTVVERRECIDKVGGFDERLPVTQDYMHWLQIALNGWAVGYIDEPLAKYRWRAGSLMSSKRKVLEDHARMFGTLLPEQYLGHALSHEAKAIVHDRFISAERELAYLDRLEGRHESARRRLMALIRQSPLEPGPYLDWAKTYFSIADISTQGCHNISEKRKG